MTSKALIGAAAVALACVSTAAFAQSRGRAAAPPATAAAPAAKPAAAALPPLISGPALPGVCLFSEQRAVAGSKAGQAANARMLQLRAQVQAELAPEGTTLQNDVRTFQAQRATATAADLETKGKALQARVEGFQQKDQLRGQELESTGEKALQRIRVELDPLVRNVYQARTCSILMNADQAVFAANPAMDITAAVITQLDTKLPTITFDREHIDPAAAAAAAAPQR